MIPRLRDQPGDLAALVNQTSLNLGIPEPYVEKDFWVTEVLREASKPIAITTKDGEIATVETLFKGGTSLSRIFGIVERFSEDVDLLIAFPENCGTGSKDTALKSIIANVGMHLGLEADKWVAAGATKGVKRNTRYEYPAKYPAPEVTEGVLLEMGSRGGLHPSEPHMMTSMIAGFAIDTLGETNESWEEFAEFKVNVLSPERTLLEKLSALHDAASRHPESIVALGTSGRHFYDVHMLLLDDRVRASLQRLGRDGIRSLTDDIEAHSLSAGFSSTPTPVEGFSSSPAFALNPAFGRVIEEAYATSSRLIYGPVPSLEECRKTVREAVDLV